MKKAVIGAAVFLVTAIVLLILLMPKEKGSAELKFLGYSSETNGLRVAQLVFTNSMDRGVEYFCQTPTNIGYQLKKRDGSVDSTLAVGLPALPLRAHQQIPFSVPVSTNTSAGLQLTVWYVVETGAIHNFLALIRQIMGKRTETQNFFASVDLP